MQTASVFINCKILSSNHMNTEGCWKLLDKTILNTETESDQTPGPC